MASAPVLVGTSGFSYRQWRVGVFYPSGMPQKSEREFFARHFRAVELNNPFYHLPSKETFSAWRGFAVRNALRLRELLEVAR